MSDLPYTRTDEELNNSITEVMEKFEEFKAFAKDSGFDIKLFPYSPESLKLYHHGDYPDMILVDKVESIVPEEKADDLIHTMIDGIRFGAAIEFAKMGYGISRRGWNGKGLEVVYQPGYPEGIPCNAQTANAWRITEGELFKCEPYLQISTVDGSHAMWVPSIRDILADDWFVVNKIITCEIDELLDALSKDAAFVNAQIKIALLNANIEDEE